MSYVGKAAERAKQDLYMKQRGLGLGLYFKDIREPT
jgi:hypothetical protein